MSEESTAQLPALGFAKDLDEEALSALGSFGQFVTLNEGDHLIEEGQSQDCLFLVISGNFHVTTAATGRDVLLGQLKAGNMIGEVNIFDPGQASANVTAHSLSQAWKIDRSSLEKFLENNSEAAARVLVGVSTQLSKRLRKTNEKVAMAREAMIDAF
ncbi:MAG: cyclic nucleotide-binding domain-containing protein [Verrucomicrobia bacterium]|nr:cyclic nucleotide-binding domain-containing protein [Verrucomicrobiota bacterium]